MITTITEDVFVNIYPDRTTVHKTEDTAISNISPNAIAKGVPAKLIYNIQPEHYYAKFLKKEIKTRS